MKKLFFILSVVFITASALLFSVSGVWAEEDYTINSFKSGIVIQDDGKVAVLETIVVDFSTPHHGIYRDIPLVYQNLDGTKQYTRIEDISISDSGRSVTFQRESNQNNVRIKIGDANKLISGIHSYQLSYRAVGVLASFTDHDELYWNITGNDWPVWIQSADASVQLEGSPITRVQCYVGLRGSNQSCGASINASGQGIFGSGHALAPGNGMTIVAAFAKGAVPIITVSAPEEAKPISLLYIIISALIIVIVTAFILGRSWWRYGRDAFYLRKSLHDPKQIESVLPLVGAHEPIVPEYDAPGTLRPAEIGVLLDEKADQLDISATIVDLAVRGYLTIAEKKDSTLFGSIDYILTKKDAELAALLPYEKELLDRLFKGRDSIAISKLKNTFSSSIKAVTKLLYASVVEKKMFVENPETVRSRYRKIGGTIAVAAGVLLVIYANNSAALPFAQSNFIGVCIGFLIGTVISGCVVFLAAYAMPKRTAYGRELYRQTLGYKLFVSGTEKYRQPFFEKQNIFMEVLPYAMVFGVTKQLAKAMEEMGINPDVSSWYIGTGYFNLRTFSNNFSGVAQSLSTAPATHSGGSGFSGGSSGGGFGGGGGGGW